MPTDWSTKQFNRWFDKKGNRESCNINDLFLLFFLHYNIHITDRTISCSIHTWKIGRHDNYTLSCSSDLSAVTGWHAGVMCWWKSSVTDKINDNAFHLNSEKVVPIPLVHPKVNSSVDNLDSEKVTFFADFRCLKCPCWKYLHKIIQWLLALGFPFSYYFAEIISVFSVVNLRKFINTENDKKRSRTSVDFQEM